MPVAYIQEFKIRDDDRSTTNYDAVTARLAVESNRLEGVIVHTAGFDENAGVFRIFEVWESREQAERFQRERLQPIIDELMASREDARPPERDDSYELHNVVR